jgi:hypothetical protein
MYSIEVQYRQLYNAQKPSEDFFPMISFVEEPHKDSLCLHLFTALNIVLYEIFILIHSTVYFQ